jgi:hypothetical protein
MQQDEILSKGKPPLLILVSFGLTKPDHFRRRIFIVTSESLHMHVFAFIVSIITFSISGLSFTTLV